MFEEPDALHTESLTTGQTVLTIKDNGNVGIGTTSPSYQLHLSTNSAGKPGGGSWTDSSDIRLKKDIIPIANALEKITKLNGINFEWVNPSEHGNLSGIQGGFIAQDVQSIFPGWVQQIDPAGADKNLIPDGQKALSLNLPFEFNALVVESIKELNTKISNLDLKLNNAGLINASSTADIISADLASGAPAKEAVTTAITANIRQWVQDALQSLGMALKDGVASLKGIIAPTATIDQIHTKQVCVGNDNGEEVCLNEQQLKDLVNRAGSSITVNQTFAPSAERPSAEIEPAFGNGPQGGAGTAPQSAGNVGSGTVEISPEQAAEIVKQIAAETATSTVPQ